MREYPTERFHQDHAHVLEPRLEEGHGVFQFHQQLSAVPRRIDAKRGKIRQAVIEQRMRQFLHRFRRGVRGCAACSAAIPDRAAARLSMPRRSARAAHRGVRSATAARRSISRSISGCVTVDRRRVCHGTISASSRALQRLHRIQPRDAAHTASASPASPSSLSASIEQHQRMRHHVGASHSSSLCRSMDAPVLPESAAPAPRARSSCRSAPVAASAGSARGRIAGGEFRPASIWIASPARPERAASSGQRERVGRRWPPQARCLFFVLVQIARSKQPTVSPAGAVCRQLLQPRLRFARWPSAFRPSTSTSEGAAGRPAGPAIHCGRPRRSSVAVTAPPPAPRSVADPAMPVRRAAPWPFGGFEQLAPVGFERQPRDVLANCPRKERPSAVGSGLSP